MNVYQIRNCEALKMVLQESREEIIRTHDSVIQMQPAELQMYGISNAQLYSNKMKQRVQVIDLSLQDLSNALEYQTNQATSNVSDVSDLPPINEEYEEV